MNSTEVSMKRKYKLFIWMMLILSTILLTGCKSEEADIKKIKDIDFTIVEDSELPEELKMLINEKKEKPFKTTWNSAEKDFLYIVIGYGQQPSGGFSITVDELYLTSNSIFISTNLIGPKPEELVTQVLTYPYVVVKMEYMDKSVVFN